MVELFVVIAMTAILSALLLPALSTAKEKSRRAVCKSNMRQVYFVCQYYADDNADVLPSAADNLGNYHAILLSSETFTNLVADYAGGSSNIFYCPNLVFNAAPNAFAENNNGYVIGYSYLASNVLATTKGADSTLLSVKLSAAPATNALLADANYWVPGQSAMAPHTAMGAAMAQTSSAHPATNSIGLGAMGGNIELFDGSVNWRTISAMQTHSASSANDAYGDW